ncbi:hypothetical protein JRO89_XS07G0262000 [Xanthoceras sorbifolium]|uniref:Deoxynucleoside kinase domain-containing protein n=1 Tax=Xanthoceras sorbifolium TaxID=99658 RepID=A0ABQ8HV32_9ROSI|nr:hypothetical protein JRO89_XS07G0262000 [Xanthoceras sorbifolium]
MQKLLRLNPSSPLLCTCAFNNPSRSFAKAKFNLQPTTMPPTAAAVFSGCGGGSAFAGALVRKPSAVSSRLQFRCSVEAKMPSASRAWLVIKKEGPGRAWFHTVVAVEGVKGGGESGNSNEEKPPGKLNRRQKSSGGGGSPGNPDLLTIPGVGPRNLRKLVDNGIGELCGNYHKNHAESITTFIKGSVDEELKDSNSDAKSAKKRITLCVEGNISVGKTTFLQRIANETLELRDLVEIVPEPIDKWQDVGLTTSIYWVLIMMRQKGMPILPELCLCHKVMQERDSSAGIKPLRLMERSVFSDRMVFVRAVHEAKYMNEMEISIYDSWFDPVVSVLPGLIPDGFIYLRATPDTCHKRMMLRKRTEEGGSASHAKDSSIHPDIRDRVFYLEGAHMHSSIQKVSCLGNCPEMVSVMVVAAEFMPRVSNHDAKLVKVARVYASQVAEFFEFVKKKKEVQSTKSAEEGGVTDNQPQVLLPHKGGFWLPDGKHFPESALKSLDFRRAMSIMSGQ